MIRPHLATEAFEPLVEDAITAIRNRAWNALYPVGGVAYNPEAAFGRYARDNGLGMPATSEVDITVSGIPYRFQGFSLGIVTARVGDWANLFMIQW
jgi:hypothetical protein